MRRSHYRTFRTKLTVTMLLGGVLLLFFIIAGAVITSQRLPDPSRFGEHAVIQSTKIYDRTGKVLLYEIHGEERRTVIPFDQIPAVVKFATLAAEDAHFYQHPAFDLRAIARAMYHNLFQRDGGPLQGGSTITQQLVKNSFLRPERTLRRKIKEVILAVKFENRYEKDEILGFYLNQIPYGSNAYGVEAASQTFFSKPAKDLSAAEAAVLAALPKAPSYYSPYGSHVEELKRRQEYIIDRMADFGWIDPEESDRSKKERLRFSRQSPGIKAPHFVLEVREQLRERYGEEMLETGGLTVLTTLDWELQQIAEDAVRKGALQNDTAWRASNAALVSEDPTTGQILAMVGSRDYFDLERDGNVNVATRVRQPGSAFKPFAYLVALQKGYTPDTVVFDVPIEFNPNCTPEGAPRRSGVKPEECYHPKNYDEKFRGPVTFRKALAQSLNVPSVQVLYLAGLKETLEIAKKFGIKTLTEPPHYYGLPLVLGGGGVKLIELVHAYSVFADDGLSHPQTMILEIKDRRGTVIENFEPQQERIIEAQYARLLNNILSDDEARQPAFQPNGPLVIPGWRAAAKTGTSQDYRDAWVIGYTPKLVTGVWVGNNDNTPMQKGGAGVMAAAPIWHEFMTKVLRDKTAEAFLEPARVTGSKPILRGTAEIIEKVKIDKRTGALASPDTPPEEIVEKEFPQMHSTLYYVDKENPQGPLPINPSQDPQFENWEASVLGWAKASLLQWNQYNLPLPEPPQTLEPTISLIEPRPWERLTSNELKIAFRVEGAQKELEEIKVFFNGRDLLSFEPSPDNLYSLFFVPAAWQTKNTLLLQARDKAGKIVQEKFTLYH